MQGDRIDSMLEILFSTLFIPVYAPLIDISIFKVLSLRRFLLFNMIPRCNPPKKGMANYFNAFYCFCFQPILLSSTNFLYLMLMMT